MNNKTKSSLLTYLFLLLTVFTIFVFTKNLYFEVVQSRDQVKVLKDKVKSKTDEHEKIAKIKSQIDSGNVKDVNFDKFLVNFSEDEILDYFYSYANNHSDGLKIESLNLIKGERNEFGFNESKINLVAVFNTEQDMIDMINFLLRSERYNFYIHEFSYPFGSFTGPVKVTIPLKVLHR